MDTWNAVLHLARVPACDQIFRQNNFSEKKKGCPWFSGVWKVTKSRWWKQIKHLISTGPVPREACSSSHGLPEHPFKDKEISRGELSATAWRRKSLEDSTPSSKDTSARHKVSALLHCHHCSSYLDLPDILDMSYSKMESHGLHL